MGKHTVKVTDQQAALVEQDSKKTISLIHKSIAPIMDCNGFDYCKHLNYGNPPQVIYKYLSWDIAKLCIENRNIRFSQPSKWNDQYEKRFYPTNCDYSNIVEKGLLQSITPKLYACCFTKNMTSEAAWKTYSYNNKMGCIQFTIDVAKLRPFLEVYAKKNNCLVYEATMKYDYSDNDISHLHEKNSKNFSSLFGDFELKNYLNLLRIKRKAFEYENEYRFFVVPQNQNSVTDEYIYVPIDWMDIVREISVESNAKEETKADVRKFIDSIGFKIQLNEFDLYRMEENIIVGE